MPKNASTENGFMNVSVKLPSDVGETLYAIAQAEQRTIRTVVQRAVMTYAEVSTEYQKQRRRDSRKEP